LNKKALFAAAEKTAKWMIANPSIDRLDANKGRTISCYDKKADMFSNHQLTVRRFVNHWPQEDLLSYEINIKNHKLTASYKFYHCFINL